MESLVAELQRILPGERLRFNEPLAHHTSFKIGGPADLLLYVQTEEEARAVWRLCRDKDVPTLCLGTGSNLLVRDGGWRGVVLKLGGDLARVVIAGVKITAYAGVTLSILAKQAQENALTGLEFAYGLPATIGGAVVMNAGAYGGQMADVVKSVTVLNAGGEEQTFTTAELDYDYRHSSLQGQSILVLSAELQATPGDKDEIDAVMTDIWARRQAKQPLDLPSAGSMFKRPTGYYAGKLIDDAGLKGRSVGGAMVSPKHAGFVVNTGGATATDVLGLVDVIKDEVRKKFDVELEMEVKVVGED